jgi:hypothetical protein
MREQKLPGKPRPRTEVLADYQAQRARVRPEMWVLRDLLMPPPEGCFDGESSSTAAARGDDQQRNVQLRLKLVDEPLGHGLPVAEAAGQTARRPRSGNEMGSLASIAG